MLNPYHIKIKVFCKDNAEAQKVQEAVTAASSDFNIIGDELLRFYAKYRQNENVLRPVISDITRNGVTSIAKHLFSLSKLK